MALLDTTVLIDLTRSAASAVRRRAEAAVLRTVHGGGARFTSRLNEAEFRVGEFRSRDPAAEAARIDGVLAGLVILDFDAACARQFAAAKAHLFRFGRPAGDLDVLIAAVALTNGESLLTRNPAHFADIPGLTVQSY